MFTRARHFSVSSAGCLLHAVPSYFLKVRLNTKTASSAGSYQQSVSTKAFCNLCKPSDAAVTTCTHFTHLSDPASPVRLQPVRGDARAVWIIPVVCFGPSASDGAFEAEYCKMRLLTMSVCLCATDSSRTAQGTFMNSDVWEFHWNSSIFSNI